MAKLPGWAKQVRGEPCPKYEVDPNKAYPDILKELRKFYENHSADPKSDTGRQFDRYFKELGAPFEQIAQYWVEVAYQCAKMEMQRILGRFNFELRIRAHGNRKDRWALKNHPDRYLKVDDDGNIVDSGVMRATNGREAREHYRRLRGFVPG